MSGRIPLAWRLADFALRLDVRDAPAEQARYATRLVADTLACALAAQSAETAGVTRYVEEASGAVANGATLLAARRSGGRSRGATRVPLAALANTTAARDLDANDLYCSDRGGDAGHFSDAIPAILAAAESAGATGSATLAAILAAYELQALLCDVAQWNRQGWHTAGLLAWATPAAVGRVANIGAADNPQRTLAHAIGIAGTTSQAFPTRLRPGEPVSGMKSLAPGLIAERVIEAVELAALGMTAPDDALERTLTHLGADPALAPVERLGTDWTITRNLIKRYPAQFLTQGRIEAALTLYREGVRASEIEEVRILGHGGVFSARVRARDAGGRRSQHALRRRHGAAAWEAHASRVCRRVR